MTLKPVISTSTADSVNKLQEIRADRYRIQSVARDLYLGQGRKLGLEFPQNFHRTAKCTHTRFEDTVSILKSKEHNKAFYTGLAVCGSVWTCPVCAAKIQEKRRIEIAKAFDWAYGHNKKVIMVTMTHSHTFEQSLSELLAMQSKAFKRVRGGKRWTNMKSSIGFIGLIRSLEVTRGANGWHPHTHEAWIVDKSVNTAELQLTISMLWFKACSSFGLVPDKRKIRSFLERSVKITDNCSTSDYLAKQDDSKHWGADRELAKASSKMGKSKGLHPFGLLADYADDTEKRYQAERFLEYSKAIKGKRQIFWSPGLKDLVNLEEKTDQELAEDQDDQADLLKELTANDWHVILNKKARAKILDIAENKGRIGIVNYLSKLYSEYYEDKNTNKHDKNTIYIDSNTGEILNYNTG